LFWNCSSEKPEAAVGFWYEVNVETIWNDPAREGIESALKRLRTAQKYRESSIEPLKQIANGLRFFLGICGSQTSLSFCPSALSY
jgi:hypothetical protein